MEKYKELLEEDEEFAEDMDAYLAEGVFWVPEIARWDYIAKHSKQAEIGQIVDSALDAIEKENVTTFEKELLKSMRNNTDILTRIKEKKALDDGLKKELADIIKNFKDNFEQ